MGAIVRPSQGVCSLLSSVGFECSLGTVKAGESAVVQFTLPTSMPGTVINRAEVTSQEPDLGNNVAIEKTTVLGMADLSVVKSASPNPVLVGKAVVFTVVAKNSRPSVAIGVEVTDKLPAGVTFVKAVPSQGSCSETMGNITCWIGTLYTCSSVDIVITVIANVVGDAVNTAAIKGNQLDPNKANNTSVAIVNVRNAKADLSVTKKDAQDPVKVGDSIVYTVTITNNGPDDATGVMLKDQVQVEEIKYPQW